MLPPLRPSPAFPHVESQSAQSVVDTVENRPDAHSVQVVPDALASVSVMEPAAQAMQSDSPIAAAAEYLPAAHPMQSVCSSLPADEYLPAPQSMQSAASSLRVVSMYFPTAQSMHAAVEAVLYLPAEHGVQLVPPPLASVSV